MLEKIKEKKTGNLKNIIDGMYQEEKEKEVLT